MEKLCRLVSSKIAKHEFNITLTDEDLDEIETMIPKNIEDIPQPPYVIIRNKVVLYLLLNNKIDGENADWMN